MKLLAAIVFALSLGTMSLFPLGLRHRAVVSCSNCKTLTTEVVNAVDSSEQRGAYYSLAILSGDNQKLPGVKGAPPVETGKGGPEAAKKPPATEPVADEGEGRGGRIRNLIGRIFHRRNRGEGDREGFRLFRGYGEGRGRCGFIRHRRGKC